ncbi:MAG: hypothetical protein PHF63_00715 [Herbinix sp.]|nr:hypothetical protein [Herbinix sp.]
MNENKNIAQVNPNQGERTTQTHTENNYHSSNNMGLKPNGSHFQFTDRDILTYIKSHFLRNNVKEYLEGRVVAKSGGREVNVVMYFDISNLEKNSNGQSTQELFIDIAPEDSNGKIPEAIFHKVKMFLIPNRYGVERVTGSSGRRFLVIKLLDIDAVFYSGFRINQFFELDIMKIQPENKGPVYFNIIKREKPQSTVSYSDIDRIEADIFKKGKKD